MSKFKVGDRIVSVRLPDGVSSQQHVVGTRGEITGIEDGDGLEYVVEFDDDDWWYCNEEDLELEKPLPSLEEAVYGLTEILTTEGGA